MKLKRFEGNPILSPHPWEDLAVFNPATWYDEQKRQVLLLYREAESAPEYKCDFGLATTSDGYRFERVSDDPVLGPSTEGFDGATIQDRRIIKIGEWFYVTYAARHYPFGQFWIPEVRQRFIQPDCPPEFPHYLKRNATLTGLAMTKHFRMRVRVGWLTDPAARRFHALAQHLLTCPAWRISTMHPIDLTIMFVYLALMAAVGWWSATKASKRAESYFWQAGACRGGSSVSRTASSGVDITGAMWFVMMFYIYGVKGVWLLWV